MTNDKAQAKPSPNVKAQMPNQAQRSKVKNQNDKSKMQKCSARLLPSRGFGSPQ
jgi:hypothetical protein